jgi:hypothetical protein
VSDSPEAQTTFLDDFDQAFDPGAINSLITVFQTVCHSIEAHRKDDLMATMVVKVLDVAKTGEFDRARFCLFTPRNA